MIPALDTLFSSAAQGSFLYYTLSSQIKTKNCRIGGIQHIVLGKLNILHP